MITYYHIENGIQDGIPKSQANWIRMQNPSQEEITSILNEFQLPKDIFIATDRPDEVARLEKISHPSKTTFYELVIFNMNPESSLPMEEQIQPISFIFSEDILITCSNQGSEIMDDIIKMHGSDVDSIESFILYAILYIYRSFIRELDYLKVAIDQLDQDARQTTSTDELFSLADTERELVFIDHSLKDQANAVTALWNESIFMDRVNNSALIYDVKLAQRHANKLVNIYRDLLTSIGGLFSDMMSHRLNLLMKFLNSAALIISVPTLISGIWGMNSQVPGEGSSEGFYIVVIFGALLTLASAIFLKYKDFTD